MRKGLFILMIIGLAMTIDAPAMAINWSATGFISVAFNAMRNADAGTKPSISLADADSLDDTGSFASMRARFKVTAKASEDLYGVFYLEMDSPRFGEPATSQVYANSWDLNAVDLEVLHIYIDFRVPPQLPIWFRIGKQGFKVRSHIFWSADIPGVSGRIIIDPINLSIMPLYAYDEDKKIETNMYGVDINLLIGPVNPGLYFAYEEVNIAGPNPDYETLWWIGAYIDGKIGSFKPCLDFIYSGGEESNRSIDDRDYKSWLVRGVLSYSWSRFEFGAGGMYVRGEDINTNDYEQFQLPRKGSKAASSTNMADYVVWWGGWMDSGCGGPNDRHLLGSTRTNYPGFWSVRGFIYCYVTDWLKLGAQVAYISDTEKGQDIIDAASGLAGDNDDDDSIGWEFDVGANIKFYKNLSWNTAFGYLVAHKGLSLVGGIKPADPCVVRSCLYYIF